ncbi:unnamed protein product, partial [Staurois parvus]
MTAQLSVELVQRRVAKRGLVIKGGKSSGAQVVKERCQPFTSYLCENSPSRFSSPERGLSYF